MHEHHAQISAQVLSECHVHISVCHADTDPGHIAALMLKFDAILLCHTASSYSRYHPSKGYWWQFKDKPQKNLNGEWVILNNAAQRCNSTRIIF